jgi:hypothetical protein
MKQRTKRRKKRRKSSFVEESRRWYEKCAAGEFLLALA